MSKRFELALDDTVVFDTVGKEPITQEALMAFANMLVEGIEEQKTAFAEMVELIKEALASDEPKDVRDVCEGIILAFEAMGLIHQEREAAEEPSDAKAANNLEAMTKDGE